LREVPRIKRSEIDAEGNVDSKITLLLDFEKPLHSQGVERHFCSSWNSPKKQLAQGHRVQRKILKVEPNNLQLAEGQLASLSGRQDSQPRRAIQYGQKAMDDNKVEHPPQQGHGRSVETTHRQLRHSPRLTCLTHAV
jgi:hypothetical protein